MNIDVKKITHYMGGNLNRKGKHFLLRMRHPLWCPQCQHIFYVCFIHILTLNLALQKECNG